jgi:hypothetical protein
MSGKMFVTAQFLFTCWYLYGMSVDGSVTVPTIYSVNLT